MFIGLAKSCSFGKLFCPRPSLTFKQGARCGCVVPTLAPRGGILPFCGERLPGLPRPRRSTFQAHGRWTGAIGAWARLMAPAADKPHFYRRDLPEQQPTLRFWKNMAVSGLGVRGRSSGSLVELSGAQRRRWAGGDGSLLEGHPSWFREVEQILAISSISLWQNKCL